MHLLGRLVDAQIATRLLGRLVNARHGEGSAKLLDLLLELEQVWVLGAVALQVGVEVLHLGGGGRLGLRRGQARVA